MIVSPYRTSVTAAMQDKGKRVDPDISKKYQPVGYVGKGTMKRRADHSYDCTKAPRTRDGKTHPGGRQLRRKLKHLSLRQGSFVPNMPNAKQTKCTMPGSMSH